MYRVDTSKNSVNQVEFVMSDGVGRSVSPSSFQYDLNPSVEADASSSRVLKRFVRANKQRAATAHL